MVFVAIFPGKFAFWMLCSVCSAGGARGAPGNLWNIAPLVSLLVVWGIRIGKFQSGWGWEGP